jgi:hypothetical protein
MTVPTVKRAQSDLKHVRIECAASISAHERTLQNAVIRYLDTLAPGKVREIARAMGFSAAYICDVRHGRRKVSEEFVSRLGRVKS